MKIFAILFSFMALKLFSCAEVSSNENSSESPAKNPNPLIQLGPDILHMIGFYLDNPFMTFGSIDTYCASTLFTFPIKTLIRERYNIPELVTEDIASNEPELKLVLWALMNYSNPSHVYRYLKNKFQNGTKFFNLLPNLMNYFCRVDAESGEARNENEIKNYFLKMIYRKKFDFFFNGDASLFHDYASCILERSYDLHESISCNPQYLEHIRTYLVSNIENSPATAAYYTLLWMKADFISNEPDMFLFDYPNNILYLIESMEYVLWHEVYVPTRLYEKVFEKINIAIADIKDERRKRYYNLMNLIRFGPDIENLYQDKIMNESYTMTEQFGFWRCASLSNKKGLFQDLFTKWKGYIYDTDFDQTLIDNPFIDEYSPLVMHKFVFDIHEAFNDHHNFFLNRHRFYDKTSIVNVLSHYFRLVSIKILSDNRALILDFERPYGSNESGIPERLAITYYFSSVHDLSKFAFNIPLNMQIDNPMAMETIINIIFRKFKRYDCLITCENMKLIMKSAYLCEMLRRISADLRGHPFEFYSLLDVVDEPVIYMGDIIKCDISPSLCTTSEQVKRMETLTGIKMNTLVTPEMDYFKYRQVFKYIMKTGQSLPSGLPTETIELISNDFPPKNALNKSDADH